jgi:hypothetical protein
MKARKNAVKRIAFEPVLSLLPSCLSRLLANETGYHDSSAVIVVRLRLRLQQTSCWPLRRRRPLHPLPFQPCVHSASVDEHSSDVLHTDACACCRTA